METLVQSAKKEVILSIDRPFVVIGEKINPTGHSRMVAAIKEENYDYILNLAKKQVAAGADIVGVNVGVPGIDEVALLPKIARMVSEVVDTPLCIDSADKNALKATLAVLQGRPLVNSVNGEEASLQAILPVIKEYQVPVVGLVMDDDGIPPTSEKRLAIARKIIERAAAMDIPVEDIVIDPLVLSVGAQSDAAFVTLQTLRLVREAFGVNFTMGASNVSFGMPSRLALNEAFMSLAMGYGATSAITDPLKMIRVIRSTDLMLGRDNHGARFIKYYRKAAKG